MPSMTLRLCASLAVWLAFVSRSPAQSDEAPPATAPALLVVAPRAFHAALEPFCEAKAAHTPVRSKALEDILEEPSGADDPEKLKRFLYGQWRDSDVRWVLLVGDADILPVRYMVLDRCTKEAFDFAFYPSDLYYADVAKADGGFEDWNAWRDGFHAGYFGEVYGERNKDGAINRDAIDYRPELAVGRWPVSTPAEAAAVAAKTLAFEAAVDAGTLPRDLAAFCVAGWIDARAALDASLDATAAGWSLRKRYYADKGQEPRTPAPNEAALVADVRDGASLVLHVGHGQDLAWDGCMKAATIAKLSGTGLPSPVMFSIGCTTARFATLPPYEAYEDACGLVHAGTNGGEIFTAPPPPPAPYARGRFNPKGLGELLVRQPGGGAVAYIGCNTGGQPCALTLMRGFLDALRESAEPRLGDLWARAVALYWERERLATLKPDEGWYPPSIFFQAMKYMLFGDPSLRLPPPAR